MGQALVKHSAMGVVAGSTPMTIASIAAPLDFMCIASHPPGMQGPCLQGLTHRDLVADIDSLREQGVGTIVTLLVDSELRFMGLSGDEIRAVCAARGIGWLRCMLAPKFYRDRERSIESVATLVRQILDIRRSVFDSIHGSSGGGGGSSSGANATTAALGGSLIMVHCSHDLARSVIVAMSVAHVLYGDRALSLFRASTVHDVLSALLQHSSNKTILALESWLEDFRAAVVPMTSSTATSTSCSNNLLCSSDPVISQSNDLRSITTSSSTSNRVSVSDASSADLALSAPASISLNSSTNSNGTSLSLTTGTSSSVSPLSSASPLAPVPPVAANVPTLTASKCFSLPVFQRPEQFSYNALPRGTAAVGTTPATVPAIGATSDNNVPSLLISPSSQDTEASTLDSSISSTLTRARDADQSISQSLSTTLDFSTHQDSSQAPQSTKATTATLFRRFSDASSENHRGAQLQVRNRTSRSNSSTDSNQVQDRPLVPGLRQAARLFRNSISQQPLNVGLKPPIISSAAVVPMAVSADASMLLRRAGANGILSHPILAIGNEYHRVPPEKNADDGLGDYAWKIYVRPRNSSFFATMCYIEAIEFRYNAYGGPEETVVRLNNAPYEVSGRAWGTFVSTVIIYFKARWGVPPMQVDHELSFQGDGSNTYRPVFLFNPSSISARIQRWRDSRHKSASDLVYSVPGAIADSLPSWAASTNLLAFSMPSNPKQLVNNQEHPQRTVVSMDDDYSPLSNERSVDTASMDLVFTPSGPLALPVTNDTRGDELGRKDDMSAEEVADISKFLNGIGCEGYLTNFVANNIGLDILPYLTTKDLKEIGITDIGSRRRMEEAIFRMQQEIGSYNVVMQSQFTASSAPSSSGTSSTVATSSDGARSPLAQRESSSSFARTVSVLAAHEISFRELVLEPQPIGRGAFGVVYKGRWRGADVAVKRIGVYLDADKLEDFRQEAAMMRKVTNHPAIVRFIGVCMDPNNLCIVTQYYPRRSLYDLVTLERLQLPQKTLVKIVRDASAGVLHLHCEKIIHRDIAARNILIDQDWNAHVSDFGMSRIKKKAYRQADSSDNGPIRWMAPEVIRDKANYSERSDSYSFGVLLWEVLARTKPFADLSRAQVAERVPNGLRLAVSPLWPQVLRSLMDDCWHAVPTNRPSFYQIFQRLDIYFNMFT